MNDVRKVIYGTIIGFFIMLGIWFSIIYVSSCGFTFTCRQAQPKLDLTPIPTLIPASHSESNMDDMEAVEFTKCQIAAIDLVGAWVSADAPDADPFPFTDVNGQPCEGSYAGDVERLFVDNSVWQSGSLGCVSCHNAELSNRSAGLDMSSYEVISSSGILGNNWENSTLNKYLSMRLTPDGHSGDLSAGNPLIFAGIQPAVEEEATPTP